ncbi:S9 family peptidase [Cryobacterium sp. CG_9.6]|uniref:S9 family peptidase n=1 Tax=Cryobacterium sp. CG_9.6 TaxID=2760710 RepID=UPI002475E1B3|nr:S9 family peptidase [Cryobacterium sp. CG_9.6]MDH6236997.1 dipeptidyl aminopeptidase/acylaminoacyl peptidase [Cryobacterium sp. CG_9.6]
MKSADLPLLQSVSRPTIHPDTSRAVVSVVRADFAADDYVGQLWTVPFGDGTTPQRLTRGHRDSSPQFSPDGTVLAFLRSGPGAPAQLFVVDAAGGEPVKVTRVTLGVSDFRWRPDSASIACVTRVPEPGRYGTVSGLEAGSEPARRITTQRYRSNGVGFTSDRRSHVFMVAVPDVWAEPVPSAVPSVRDAVDATGAVAQPVDSSNSAPLGFPQARQVSAGDYDHAGLIFSADGSRLLSVSARHLDRDRDLRSEVVEFAVPVDLSAAEDALSFRVVVSENENLSISTITMAEDGQLFLLATNVGISGRDFVGANTALYVLEASGERSPHRVTDPNVIDLDASGGLSVTADGQVLAQNCSRGEVHLVRIDSEGVLDPVSSGAMVVTAHDSVGSTIVYAFQDGSTAGDLRLVGSGSTTLTDFSAPVRQLGVAPVAELTVQGRDGYPVHGWVLTPPGDGPHPVLLNIHGGPFAQYTVALLDEAQVYVDAGYAVVMCNPRGSAGYGQAHGQSIRGALGTVDQDDVLDFLDGALAARPRLDSARVGIMGGSYGGYLTAWIIAHDHRFVASIVERGYLDPERFIGTSDIGDFFSEEYTGTNVEDMQRQSPQAVVGNVSTPTLVMHSADDLRCPLSQGERYYSALKRGGVHSELVIFPGENHELSRGGSPRHRLQRFEIILEWWACFLPSAQNLGSDTAGQPRCDAS